MDNRAKMRRSLPAVPVGLVRSFLRWTLPFVLVVAVLPLLTAAGRLKESWVVPSGTIEIDQAYLESAPAKFCALTFDDGPDSTYTLQVSAVLDAYGVKGTFFLIGRRIEGYPQQVQALARAGHELGNHSFTHPALPSLSSAKQSEELQRTAEALRGLGLTSRWFRPPYGDFNSTTIAVAGELGLVPILWSVDPRDWAQPGAETIRSRVLRQVGPGAVILLHSTNPQTVSALPGIIEGLGSRGYSFVTLSQWSELVGGRGVVPPAAPELGERAWPPGGDRPTLPPLPLVGGERMAPGFYSPFESEGPALSGGGRRGTIVPGAEAPRVIEHIELRTPANLAHVAWSGIRRAALKGAAWQPALAEPAAAQPVGPGAALRVYANFAGVRDIPRVAREGGYARLRLIQGAAGGAPEGQVTDVAVVPGRTLPTLPEGEEWVIPPAGISLEEGLPPVEPPGAVAPTAEEYMPLPLLSTNLLDFDNPFTEWPVPQSIDTTRFAAGPRVPPADEPPLEPRFYFLSLACDPGCYTWVELDTYVRLAKLSGLVLAREYTRCAPSCALSYPYAFYCATSLEQGALVDLTTDGAAKAVEALAAGHQDVFIVVHPWSLHFFVASTTLARMNGNMRDFVLLRQLTGGLTLDTTETVAADWELPPGIELRRFSGGSRVALVLYSLQQPQDVTVPAPYSHFSRALIEPGGYLTLAPLDAVVLSVGASPVILYYEYAQGGA